MSNNEYILMLQRRLSVGIPLSSALTKHLVREMESWPKDIFLKVERENLHVVLFSLGFIREEYVADVCEKVRRCAEQRDAFEMSFSGIRVMPNEAEAKLVQVCGESNDALRDLKTALQKALSYGMATEPKTYRPHITLARIKKARFHAQTPKLLLEKKMRLVEPVESVVVYESLMEEGKRTYSVLETVPLA